MIKADFHVHTGFSSDSQTEPKEMIGKAIALGLETICFTDHFDKDYPDYGDGCDFILDTDKYFPKIRELQAAYEDRIQIRIGAELGLQPHLGAFYHEYVKKYPFDCVIGSTHIVDGEDPHYGKLFEGRTESEGYRHFFEGILHNLQNNSDYDVVGHIDYVVRYGKNRAENYSYKKYADVLDEILRHVVEQGKGIEFNTAGFKYGLDFGHPHPDILKRYRELGGEIITIGSDGHKPEHIAYDFHRVSDILKACGFKNYTEFKQRKPIFRQLP